MASNHGPNGPAPKAMSSRLLTMKFMQRAAAASSSNLHDLTTSDGPSPKRRKKDADFSSPSFDIDAVTGRTALQAAMAEEEAKRQVALDSQAAELGDTRWVLSFENQKNSVAANPPVRIVHAGFASLDSNASSRHIQENEDVEDRPGMVGRRSFGRFNKVLEKQQNPAFEDRESESSSDEEGEASESDNDRDSDDPNGITDLIRTEAPQRLKAERKAKKKVANATAAKLSKNRKKKVLKLNEAQRTSLTGRQKAPIAKAPMACFGCGGPHMVAVCPQKTRK